MPGCWACGLAGAVRLGTARCQPASRARDALHNSGGTVVRGSGWAARRLFAANSIAIGKKNNAADRPSPRYHKPQGVMQRVPRVRADVSLHGFQAWTEAVGASAEPAPDRLQISTADDAQQPRHAGGERSESAGSMAEEESRILSTLFALNPGRQTWSWGAIDVPWPLSRVAQPDHIPITSPA